MTDEIIEVFFTKDFVHLSTPSSSNWHKVRKKPIEVLALQIHKPFIVHTLEGEMLGQPGDYLIRGVEGECYPCKKEIFEKTYEILE